MIGTVVMQLSTPLSTFRLELKRNITVIKDEGATGKSCLCALIERYRNTRGTPEGKDIQYTATHNVQPRLLTRGVWNDGDYKHWMQPMILFIDESWHIAETTEFEQFVRNSPHYFVIISRNLSKLRGLTFSVNSIMALTGDKSKYLIPWSESATCINSGVIQHTGDLWYKTRLPVKPNKVITEDSGAGYQFFHTLCGDDCVPSGDFENGKPTGGKNKVLARVDELLKDSRNFVLAFADGAAFGGELEYMLVQNLMHSNVAYYLYESFEWLLLQTPKVYRSSKSAREAITNPVVDSTCYFTWERYFTAVLQEVTKKEHGYHYNKLKIPQGYLQQINMTYLLSLLHHVSFEYWQKPVLSTTVLQHNKEEKDAFAQCTFEYCALQDCVKAFRKNASKLWFCSGILKMSDKKLHGYWFYNPHKHICYLWNRELVKHVKSCSGKRVLKSEALQIITRNIKQ